MRLSCKTAHTNQKSKRLASPIFLTAPKVFHNLFKLALRLKPSLRVSMENQPKFIVKKPEIAARYSVSVRQVTNWMQRRILPYIKDGRIVRFDTRECDKAIAALQVQSRLLAWQQPKAA
jgi:hypothetical protein